MARENINVVYANTIGRASLEVLELPRQRIYNDDAINQHDRVYQIHTTGAYQLTIDDACRIVYYLLKNKIRDKPFKEYKYKINSAIYQAERERDLRKEYILTQNETLDIFM